MRQQKRIEQLIAQISDASRMIMELDPDLKIGLKRHYDFNIPYKIEVGYSTDNHFSSIGSLDEVLFETDFQSARALATGTNAVVELKGLYDSIVDAASEGENFGDLLSLLRQWKVEENSGRMGYAAVVNVGGLINYAKLLHSIAKDSFISQRCHEQAQFATQKLEYVLNNFKVGKLPGKLPREFEGEMSIDTMARLMFNGAAPTKPTDIEPYVQRLAEAYMWFGKSTLKTIKKYTGFPVRIKDETKQAAKRAGVETFEALESLVGNHPKLDQIVSSVVRYVERLSKFNYTRTQSLQDVSKTVKKVIEWCDDPELMTQHLQEYKSIIDMLAKSRDRVAKVSYLTCRGY